MSLKCIQMASGEVHVGAHTDQVQRGSNLQGHQVHCSTTPASAQYEQESLGGSMPTSPSSNRSTSTPFLGEQHVLALTEGKAKVIPTSLPTSIPTSPSSVAFRPDAAPHGSPATDLQATLYSTRQGDVGTAEGAASICEFSARKPTSPSQGSGDTGDGDCTTTSSSCSLSSTHKRLINAVKGTIARVRSL